MCCYLITNSYVQYCISFSYTEYHNMNINNTCLYYYYYYYYYYYLHMITTYVPSTLFK